MMFLRLITTTPLIISRSARSEIRNRIVIPPRDFLIVSAVKIGWKLRVPHMKFAYCGGQVNDEDCLGYQQDRNRGDLTPCDHRV